MAVSKKQKEDIVKKFRQGELDTGSSEVQVALLTARINQLTQHFSTHGKDHHGKLGLVKAVNRRRKLLDYLRKSDSARYEKVIRALDIRK